MSSIESIAARALVLLVKLRESNQELAERVERMTESSDLISVSDPA